MENVWKELLEVPNENKESLWKIVTQADHPVLGIPFFQVHPCETKTLMKELFDTSREEVQDPAKYLLSWMSVMGNLVNFDTHHLRQKFLEKKQL